MSRYTVEYSDRDLARIMDGEKQVGYMLAQS